MSTVNCEKKLNTAFAEWEDSSSVDHLLANSLSELPRSSTPIKDTQLPQIDFSITYENNRLVFEVDKVSDILSKVQFVKK